MSQFDVFRNPGRRADLVPFFVSLQNTRHDVAGSRFVGPLVPVAVLRSKAPWLAPTFVVAGQLVGLDVLNLATLPAARLGAPIATLADEDSRARLVRALDEFLSQA